MVNTRVATRQLHDLFAEDWEWSLTVSPEWATHLGDSRYNDRLTDLSPAGIERCKAHEREMLDRIRQIDRNTLSGQDAISYDLFLRDKEINVESQRFPIELLALTQIDGPQISFGQLVAAMPFETVRDYENYLKRLEAFPSYLDQVKELLGDGIRIGWMPPAFPLRTVPKQIEGQIFSDISESALHAPFTRFPQDITAAGCRQLSAAGESLLRNRVMPALQSLHAFVEGTYLPSCRSDISARTLKDGANYYQLEIRRLTTTELTAQQIH